MTLIFICLFSFFLSACSDSEDISPGGEAGDRSPESEIQANLPKNDEKITISQGVWGNVWFWEGNHMPTLDENPVSGTITPVEREIYIHEATTIHDVSSAQDYSFYSEIHTPLMATTVSDADGFFQASLQPGSYSVFVKENNLFYAASFSGTGEINPVTVRQDTVQKVQVDITYQATF
ncbi:MAG: carboxypeptidase regulatory-like domain-containing protein [Desulfobacteraceae bacterium]|nr:MAG: carboxypeptidase regulatory-like domain-containing protein [Desulfobacteraceae bacterium]